MMEYKDKCIVSYLFLKHRFKLWSELQTDLTYEDRDLLSEKNNLHVSPVWLPCNIYETLSFEAMINYLFWR